MDLFDTHAHLDDESYDEDRDEVIQRARQRGIRHIVNIGFDLASSRESINLQKAMILFTPPWEFTPMTRLKRAPATWRNWRK
jgi:Tat protein secretion system quality control protein TatD with DNase activity